MSEQLWVKIEALPAYFREDNPLADACDYRAFIDQTLVHLHTDALRCYRKHGRGVIVLGRPRGLFVESEYALPRSDHPFYLATACLPDLLQYDPANEFLVGIGDGAEHPVRVWRVKADQAAPSALWRDFDLSAK